MRLAHTVRFDELRGGRRQAQVKREEEERAGGDRLTGGSMGAS